MKISVAKDLVWFDFFWLFVSDTFPHWCKVTPEILQKKKKNQKKKREEVVFCSSTSVYTKIMIINQGSYCHVVKQLCEALPRIGISIFSHTFAIESIHLLGMHASKRANHSFVFS